MSSALPAAWMSDIIKQKKALNMHHYMHYCLFDKTYGYYMNKQVFGREGDFITAADISQLFGETIAIWAIDKWKKMGYPKHFNLIELGPGRATMMVDFLNIAKHWPEFIKACQFYFVEISPALQNLQQKRLQPILKKLCCQAVWVDDIDRVEMGTNLVIANEFFDALPIRQFCFNQGQWFERLVSLEQDQTLRFICADEPTLINDQTGDLKACDGDIFEIGTVAHQIAKKLAERAQKAQTHGLIIDYGYLKTAFGDSLQGLKNHRYHDIFLDQGAVDLT
ncbi:MAG: SAM-dependent methyltransferase, partial [Pseudomonadota bacterium]